MEALTAVRARQEDSRCIHDQTCNEAAVVEKNCTNAIEDVLWKSRSAREAREDGDDAGKLTPNHRKRSLPNDPGAT